MLNILCSIGAGKKPGSDSKATCKGKQAKCIRQLCAGSIERDSLAQRDELTKGVAVVRPELNGIYSTPQPL